MSEVRVRMCHFCNEYFPSDKVKEVTLESSPNSSIMRVYSCEDCLKTTKVERKTERLFAKAYKVLQDTSLTYSFNEIELADGDVKVHLVRFTPVPYTVPPFTVLQK
jgi:hypothetical protein